MNDPQVVEAARELIFNQETPMVMATVSPANTPHVFYMGAVVLEDPFTLYLETSMLSAKVEHLRQNPNVELVIASPDYMKVVTLTGTAEMENSPEKKAEIWNKISLSANYFSGPESPEFGLIKMTVHKIQLQQASQRNFTPHVVLL